MCLLNNHWKCSSKHAPFELSQWKKWRAASCSHLPKPKKCRNFHWCMVTGWVNFFKNSTQHLILSVKCKIFSGLAESARTVFFFLNVKSLKQLFNFTLCLAYTVFFLLSASVVVQSLDLTGATTSNSMSVYQLFSHILS